MSESGPTAPRVFLSPPPIRTEVVGSRVFVYDSVDSTSTRAREIGGDGTVVIAESQTDGRGRHGRSWHSAPGLGLWFSVAFDGIMEGLSLAAAVAIRNALLPLCQATVKWPNDLLLSGRKFCGILVEHRDRQTVLGIGINVHHRPDDFPPELRELVTSIEQETGTTCDRNTILGAVLTSLDEQVMVLRSGNYDRVRREWAEACRIKGCVIRSEGFEGRVIDIDSHGALVLLTTQGERRVLSGEIHVVEGV